VSYPERPSPAEAAAGATATSWPGPTGSSYVALERREGREMTRPLGLVIRLVPVGG